MNNGKKSWFQHGQLNSLRMSSFGYATPFCRLFTLYRRFPLIPVLPLSPPSIIPISGLLFRRRLSHYFTWTPKYLSPITLKRKRIGNTSVYFPLSLAYSSSFGWWCGKWLSETEDSLIIFTLMPSFPICWYFHWAPRIVSFPITKKNRKWIAPKKMNDYGLNYLFFDPKFHPILCLI